MTCFIRLAVVVLALAVVSAAQSGSEAKPRFVSPQARALHDSALIIDTHADTTQYFLDPDFDIGAPHPGHDISVDLDKARAGNLGAQFFSIWVDPSRVTTGFAHRTLDQIDAVHRQAAKNSARMQLVTSADGILAAHRAGKFAALMGIEGGHSIENDTSLLRDYYRLGVRYMTVTWSNSTDWAESSGTVKVPGVTPPKGLNDFGRDVVREMNRLGMMVDISHVSDQTFWDVIATTKAPVIASHSSARALTQHARNMTDEMLRAVSRNGGVVMVNYFSGFVDQKFLDAMNAHRKEYDALEDEVYARNKDANPGVLYRATNRAGTEYLAKLGRPPFDSLIDNIDHVAKVAGIDHVGLGSDFDGVTSLPSEIDTAADLPKITQALLDRGYSPEQVRKVLGLNLLRVMRECERVGRRLNAKSQASGYTVKPQ